MFLVPLQAIQKQNILTNLDNETVQLNVYQLRYGMFIDIYVNAALLIGAVICRNLTLIIRDNYWSTNLGFAGDFIFNDLFGSTDPVYTGLGTQYQLLYLSPTEVASIPLFIPPPAIVLPPFTLTSESGVLLTDEAGGQQLISG